MCFKSCAEYVENYRLKKYRKYYKKYRRAEKFYNIKEAFYWKKKLDRIADKIKTDIVKPIL